MTRVAKTTCLFLCSSLLGLGGGLVSCGANVSCDADQSARSSTILSLGVDSTAGAEVFAGSCGSGGCHGSDGNEGPAPNLGARVGRYDSEELACLLLGGTGSMPAQAGLSDQQLADVLAYVEEEFM